jgi:hypothetical protein
LTGWRQRSKATVSVASSWLAAESSRRALGLAGAERRRDRSQVRQFIQIALGGLARAIDGCEAGTRVNRDINRPSR